VLRLKELRDRKADTASLRLRLTRGTSGKEGVAGFAGDR